MNCFSHFCLFLTAGAITAVALTSCSMLQQALPGSADQSIHSSQSTSISSDTSSAAEEYTLQGTLNILDSGLEYLVIISDDLCFRFDFSGTDVDLSGLAPGDLVTVTYTGLLEPNSEEITAQLIAITKDE